MTKWKMGGEGLKIHISVDINSKRIVSVKITDERSHDAQHLPSLVDQALYHSRVVKVPADAA